MQEEKKNPVEIVEGFGWGPATHEGRQNLDLAAVSFDARRKGGKVRKEFHGASHFAVCTPV